MKQLSATVVAPSMLSPKLCLPQQWWPQQFCSRTSAHNSRAYRQGREARPGAV